MRSRGLPPRPRVSRVAPFIRRSPLLKRLLASALTLTALAASAAQAQQAPPALLNTSYDIARELFAAINPKFQADWKARTGQDVRIEQSFAGTSRQAQSIIHGPVSYTHLL